MAKVGFYVDGFNLFHAIEGLGDSRLKWLNLKALANSFLRPGDSMECVKYFTAIQLHDQIKQQRHKQYLAALRAVGVEVVESNFKKAKKFCFENDRYCMFREEKQTDVALATSYLLDVIEGKIDRLILVTADSDQIPAIRAILQRKPNFDRLLAPPPGRLQEARDLGNHFSDRREISLGRMTQCLLPRNVVSPTSGKVVAVCPVAYQ
ncbi:NYN domain-containing protein [Luteimonas sp. SMYT11W]|uniref:NYN domain-containing protein n=1 Tax=Luteimonas flava TaxID=3115822 RepID=A0ABU7WFV8_9GAMM